MMTTAIRTVSVAWLAGVLACTGQIDDPTGANGGSAGPGGRLGGPAGGGTCLEAPTPGPLAPLQRLTRTEYDNTVRDLLGDDSRPAAVFPPDENLHGFELGATVSPLQYELYMNVAEDLAANADLDTLLSSHCTAESLDESCARSFIRDFGMRAYRRPVEEAQVERLLTVWRTGVELEDAAMATRMVVQAMLQSPHFLYRVELGVADPAAGDDVVALDSWERASRLSYLIWSSMPDDELFAAAAADELASADGIAAQARRMLEDPRAREAMRGFYLRWLELDLSSVSKDPELFPEFDYDMARSMETEVAMRIDHALWEGTGTLDELLTAPYTFVDERLAAIYGLEGITGDEFVRVELDPSERPGLFTVPGIMAMRSHPNQTSPVLRGQFVRERILCQHLPPPPPDLVVFAPEVTEGQSTRDRFEQHRSDPSCSSCHELMDPIGYGFENFDSIGRFRATDEGQPIDASGEIIATEHTNGTFDGPAELMELLGSSRDVQSCMTVQWFRNALRRTETDEDGCAIQEVQESFAATGNDLRELVVALVQTDAFLYRRASGSEAP